MAKLQVGENCCAYWDETFGDPPRGTLMGSGVWLRRIYISQQYGKSLESEVTISKIKRQQLSFTLK